VSAMGGANTGRSNEEEDNPPEELRHTDADNQHRDNLIAHTTRGLEAPSTESLHLPGPPSRRTTAQTRATTPHDPAAHSPSCTGQTARRPRPPHQHPGPPPRPKSQTASPKTASTEPTASPHQQHKTVTQSMQAAAPPHEATAHHVSRGRRLDAQPPSGAAAPTSTNLNAREAAHHCQLTLQGDAHKRDAT
jgi:hypothetical protein